MFRKHNKNRASSGHTHEQIAPLETELEHAQKAARTVFGLVANDQSSRLFARAGYTVDFDKEHARATLTQRDSVSQWLTVGIGRNADGAWHVEVTQATPSLETEAFGGTTVQSDIYPLVADEPTAHGMTTYRSQRNGDLVSPDIHGMHIGEPLTAETAHSLSHELTQLAHIASPRALAGRALDNRNI